MHGNDIIYVVFAWDGVKLLDLQIEGIHSSRFFWAIYRHSELIEGVLEPLFSQGCITSGRNTILASILKASILEAYIF
jgi:hypothetical protein